MLDRQIRWMMGLTVAVLAVAAALYLDEPSDDSADPTATVALLDLPDLQAVTELRLDRRGDVVVLVRADEGWRVTEPFQALADGDRVERLLDDLREVSNGVPLDVQAASLDTFGLGDPPRLVVTLNLDGAEPQVLTLGDEAPVGWSSYARSASGDVVVVPGQPGRIAMEGAESFRDHRLIRIDPAEVRGVTLSGPEGTLTVTGQGLDWWLEGHARADADRVDDLVLGLMDLRFDRILPLNTDIEAPERTAKVTLASGAVHTISVGSSTPMGRLVQTDSALGVVFPESLAIFGMGPRDIGLSQAFPLRLERADRVRITGGDEPWQAERTDRDWASPGLSSTEAWGQVNRLAQVAHVYRPQPPLPISEVYRTVEIVEGERTLVVDVGQEVEPGMRVAVDRAGGQPFRIATDALDFLTL